MKKYVDLDAIIDRLDDEWGFLGMREELFNLPAADVAEIVRCKDCKHFCEKEGKCYGQDIRAEEGHDCYKNDDDFCSCSERK